MRRPGQASLNARNSRRIQSTLVFLDSVRSPKKLLRNSADKAILRCFTAKEKFMRGISVKTLFYTILTISLLPGVARATVTISSPANGQTLTSSVHYAGTATTSTCSRGVASMGVYVDDKLTYVGNGAKLDTTLSLTVGKHTSVLQEWDYCGGSTFASLAIAVTGQSGIFIASPANNSSVSSPASYVATATTATCSKGIASMGVYVDNKLVVVQNGASLNAQVALAAGLQNTVVQEWYHCGGSAYVPVNVTVKGASTTTSENVLANLQASEGWESWGQVPPNYVDCAPCSGIEWSTTQGIKSPSLSDNATEFSTSGTKPYAVVLWVNPVIGTYSTQGLPDQNHTLVPSLHNFTYDTDVYITNWSVTAVLEFDVSMYMNGVGMSFDTQCNHLNGGEWDVLNNVTQHWSATPTECSMVNGWNHLTLQFQRDANNNLIYKTITVNGVTANINETFAPFSVPTDWYGITVNYQMDGDSKQSANTTYLDNLSLTYW